MTGDTGYTPAEWKAKREAEAEKRVSNEIDRAIDRAAGNSSTTPSNCYSDFIAYKRRLKTATEAFCTCGGKGPEDFGCCPACKIYHAMGIGTERGL